MYVGVHPTVAIEVGGHRPGSRSLPLQGTGKLWKYAITGVSVPKRILIARSSALEAMFHP